MLYWQTTLTVMNEWMNDLHCHILLFCKVAWRSFHLDSHFSLVFIGLLRVIISFGSKSMNEWEKCLQQCHCQLGTFNLTITFYDIWLNVNRKTVTAFIFFTRINREIFTRAGVLQKKEKVFTSNSELYMNQNSKLKTNLKIRKLN